jgi:hypothetical protein
MTECTRGLFGPRPHKFEARYENIPVDFPDLVRKLALAGVYNIKISDEMAALLCAKHYVCDVCVKCGAIAYKGEVG